MENVYYDLIYLTACGVNEILPSKECLEKLEIERLYGVSGKHLLDALVGMTLQKAGVELPKVWVQQVAKAVRKNILFDAERIKIFSFMEQKEIWYLPLKGIVLKDFYPAVGMRQMSDNDILFDADFDQVLKRYMESQGYEVISAGQGNHDVYHKAPVYNFEMHRTLYGTSHPQGWEVYYRDIKERLVQDGDTTCAYCFRDEDFYVYMVSHAFKHYSGSGTGLRTLLDFYVYLLKKEQSMDFAYIHRECQNLGVAEFEEKSRALCKKAFGAEFPYGREVWEGALTAADKEMLLYYLSSGVYGTMEHRVKNNIRKLQEDKKGNQKLRYIWRRLFPGKDIYKYYLNGNESKWLMSWGWLKRVATSLLDKERRIRICKEIKMVKKI